MGNENYFDPSKTQEPELEQAGWYALEIVELQRRIANTLSEGFQFVFQILHPTSKANGFRIKEIFWDTPAALPRLGTFTSRFYQGPPYSLSDPEAMWRVYGGARVYAEIGFKTNDDGTRGYPEIRRFGTMPETVRTQILAFPRVAAAFPQEGMLTNQPFKAKRNGSAPAASGGMPPQDTAFGGNGSQDDDIPF
jgi:hypothetical protein